MRLRPHARALVRPLVVLLLVLALAGFLTGWLPEGRWQRPGRAGVVVLSVAVLARGALLPWLRWLTTAFVVTDRRISLQRGVLRRSTRDVPLSRVADVGVERSLLQRLLRSGTLVIDTVGERGQVVVRDVPGALHVRDELTDLLDADDRDDADDAGRR